MSAMPNKGEFDPTSREAVVARIDPVLIAVATEIERQDRIHPTGFPPTREGVRYGLATIADELQETLDAWREERRADDWRLTAEELVQVAAVAVRVLREIGVGASAPVREKRRPCPVCGWHDSDGGCNCG